MFYCGHWAAALVNSIEKEGGDIEDGIAVLNIFAAWVKNLPNGVFGTSAAKKAELLIREAMAKNGAISPARESAIRFFAMMVKKNKTGHLDAVVEEAKKLLDKKNGVIAASVESAFPIDEAVESRIREGIKKRTGAARVDLAWQHRPELIGGYRLRIGNEIIDASVRSQLRKLLAALQSSQTGLAADGGL